MENGQFVKINDRKILLIDYLKGYSILTIVAMHLITIYLDVPLIINKIASIGGSGVHIFIICSGFGLYYSYLKKPCSFKMFIKRRFGKIYNPYIVIIIISALFPFMYNQQHKFIAILSHIFLFKMFNNTYECSFGVQFWFISTIIQFYLVFPLVVKLKSRFNNKMFLSICLIISFCWWILVAYIAKGEIRVWNSFFLQYLWEFAIGMIIANIIYVKSKIKMANKITLFLLSIIGLSITAITGLSGGVFRLFNDIPTVIGYGSLAILIYSFNNKFINNFIIKISKISYELYLVHILVFSIIFNSNITFINKYILGIISILISILIAKIYNCLFTLLLTKKNVLIKY